MPEMLKWSVIPPPELSIFADQPLVPPLGGTDGPGPDDAGVGGGAAPARDAGTGGKPALEVMVMAACCPVPARAGAAGTANSTASVKGDNTRRSRRMRVLPWFRPGPLPSTPAPWFTERSRTGSQASG